MGNLVRTNPCSLAVRKIFFGSMKNNLLSYYCVRYILCYIIAFILGIPLLGIFLDRSPMLPPMFFDQMFLLQNNPQYGPI